MYSERALSCFTSNRLMLTNLVCSISRAWDYSTVLRLLHRQTWINGFMAQKAEKMLPKILNKWLCNVKLFPWVWILDISRKAFRMSLSVSGSRLKAVFGYQYPVSKSLSCWISNRQSDHLSIEHRARATQCCQPCGIPANLGLFFVELRFVWRLAGCLFLGLF